MTESQLTGWDPFLGWAGFFYGTPTFNFDIDERESKILAVAPFQEARTVLDGGDWLRLVRRGFQNPQANLVSHWQFTPFLDWASNEAAVAPEALRALWQEGDAKAEQRLDAFDALFPRSVLSGPGSRCNLAAYLLSAADPIGWPNYRVTATALACELTRHPLPDPACTLGARYQHALDFYDAIIEQAHRRDIPLRDRLDAQGLLWCIAGTMPGDRPASFTVAEWEAFRQFRTIPYVGRKPRGTSPKPRPPRRHPPHPVCPICGNDDEVHLIASLDDGWVFVCEVGSRHPVPFEPYEFSAT
jgi:5-methylcytosine-specific restriction enzyme B